MATVDTLIDNRAADIAGLKALLEILVNQLRNYALDGQTGLYLPGIKNPDGTVTSGLDISRIIFPNYVSPVKEAIAMPSYEPPDGTLPIAPDLNDIPNIIQPPQRTIPDVDVSDLFKQTKPSDNLPDLAVSNPDLHIAEYLEEIAALIAPALSNLVFPTLSDFNIGDIPTVILPSYSPTGSPDTLDRPIDYAEAFDAQYRKMLPEMQSYVDGRTQVLIDTYAPGFHNIRSKLEIEVSRALDGGSALSDQFESAIFNRDRSRIQKEFKGEEKKVLDAGALSGMFHPPGAVTGQLHDLRMRRASNVSTASNNAAIRRYEMEFQFKQFILSQANAMIDGVRAWVASYASSVMLNEISSATNYANLMAGFYIRIFEHEVEHRKIQINILTELRSQFEGLLKNSIARYEDIKMRLEVEKARKDVEKNHIEALDLQSQAEYRQVQRYTAMIEAISRKAEISEKQIKQIDAQGRVFQLNVDKAKATHDIYLASLEGDSKMYEGRLTALKVIDEQLRADNQMIQSQQLLLDAISKKNAAQISSFEVQKDAYKLEAEIALQKFTSLIRIKELGEEIYKNEIQNAITQFKSQFETAFKEADLTTKVYELSVNTAFKESDIFMRFKDILVDAMKLPIDVYGNTLSAAYSAMQATLAKSVEAAA